MHDFAQMLTILFLRNFALKNANEFCEIALKSALRALPADRLVRSHGRTRARESAAVAAHELAAELAGALVARDSCMRANFSKKH